MKIAEVADHFTNGPNWSISIWMSHRSSRQESHALSNTIFFFTTSGFGEKKKHLHLS